MSEEVGRFEPYSVGEVVVHPQYGRGIVTQTDEVGYYIKVTYEDSFAHDWAVWWFSPDTVTKLQDMEKIKKGGE